MGYVNKVNIGSETHLIEPTLYGTSSTAAGTAIKNVSIDSNFTLTTGVQIYVKFSVTNTAAVGNLKLKFNSEADANAKPIKCNGSNIYAASLLSADYIHSFIYNGTNWEYIGPSMVRLAASSTTSWRNILLGIDATNAANTTASENYGPSYVATGVSVLPSTGSLYATNFLPHVLTAETNGTLHSTAGTFPISITSTAALSDITGSTTSNYDFVGLLIGDANDKFQLLAHGNRLYMRQNDSGDINTSNWTDWKKILTVDDVGTAANYNVGVLYRLTGGTVIENGTDLDTIRAVGNYRLSYANSTGSISNLPAGHTAFVMKVISATGDGTTYLKQVYLNYNKLFTFTRYLNQYNDPNASWGSWYFSPMMTGFGTAKGAANKPVYINDNGIITAGTEIGASAYHADNYFALASHTHGNINSDGTVDGTNAKANRLMVSNASGVITTDDKLQYDYNSGALSFGTSSSATITAVLYGTLDIKSASGFTYSGMGTGTANVDRPLWFMASSSGAIVNGLPVYSNDLKYNPSTKTLKIDGATITSTAYSGSAAKLTSGKTLKVSLSSTNASTAFDGSANITDIGVSGTLAIANGGTGKSNDASPNTVFAGPSTGSNNGTPIWRALVAADIPNLSWNKITSDKPTTIAGYGITDVATNDHVHGNITNDGKIGSTADYAVYTTTDGTVIAGSLTVTDDTTTTITATATTFVSAVTQSSIGKITVTKKNLPTASTTVAGITTVGASGGAAAYSHTHDYLSNANTGASDLPVYITNNTPTATTYRMAATNTIATTSVNIADNLTTGIWYAKTANSSDVGIFGSGINDGAIYAEQYSTNWIHEIYGDYRTGQIAVRAKNSGTWTDWRIVLDEDNYTNYPAAELTHTLATTTKYYISGTTRTTTGASEATFDTGIYSTTTAGELSAVDYALNVSGTEKAKMIYNSTDDTIDFVFI